MTFVAGSLLAGILILLCLATASTSAGCTTADTNPAPDAALPPCNRGPFIFCSEVGQDQPGCNTADGTSSLLSVLPRVRYGVGCIVDYVGARDPQGDCRLEAVCKCVIGEIRTTSPNDGGGTDDGGSTDAGEDADASTSPPPAPEPSATGPVWQCYP